MLSPGNIPTEVEAFPELFLDDAPLPKAGAQLSSYLRSALNSLVHLEQHGSVFTRSPALRNLQALFSFQGAIKIIAP